MSMLAPSSFDETGPDEPHHQTSMRSLPILGIEGPRMRMTNAEMLAWAFQKRVRDEGIRWIIRPTVPPSLTVEVGPAEAVIRVPIRVPDLLSRKDLICFREDSRDLVVETWTGLCAGRPEPQDPPNYLVPFAAVTVQARATSIQECDIELIDPEPSRRV